MTTDPASNAGKALASFRQRVEIVCEECGKESMPMKRSGASAPRFCSPTCRHKAWRRKKREKEQS